MARKRKRNVLNKKDKLLDEIYQTPGNPGSFGSIARLLKAAQEAGHTHISREDVLKYLKKTDSYTLHRPHRIHFLRSKTIVGGIEKQWQADLSDLSDLSEENDGNRYILTVIDCFSKYAWAIPIKRKDAKTLEQAFTTLFLIADPRVPVRLQTDKGLEFYNPRVKALLASKNILLFSTHSDTKAAIVERFNRTLKTRMFEYFTAKKTNRYMDVLDKLLHSYNHSIHRTIGMKPADVERKHDEAIFALVYGKELAKAYIKDGSIKPNSTVRISRIKRDFEKGYTPNWSTEEFKVKQLQPEYGRELYKLKDSAGEELKGTFYREEIQPIQAKPKSHLFEIESILKSRTTSTGAKEHLVKYKGYPKKFNAWVKDKDLKKL